MKTFFKLSEIAQNTLVGRDIGKQTREHIQELVTEHGQIEIDMENKTSISPSFLEEAFVLLVLKYGKENFKEVITLTNINDGIKSLMNSMLAKRIERS